MSLDDQLPTIQRNSAFIFKGLEVIVFYYIPTPDCFDLKVIEENFIGVVMRQRESMGW
jgi:hypothetical protein